MNSAMLILWIPLDSEDLLLHEKSLPQDIFQNPAGCMIAKPELNYAIEYKGERASSY